MIKTINNQKHIITYCFNSQEEMNRFLDRTKIIEMINHENPNIQPKQ